MRNIVAESLRTAQVVGCWMLIASLLGCGQDDDRREPMLVSLSLVDGSTEIDPDLTKEVVALFDEPLDASRGRAILRTSQGEVEVPVSWSQQATMVTLSLDGLIVVDRRYRLVLEDFADPSGNLVDAAAELPDGALRFATKRVDREAPTLVSSVPMDGQVGVYPASVFDGTAPSVRVRVRFSEPMESVDAPVTWGPVGRPHSAITGAWSSDQTELLIEIEAPPFAGRRPLENETLYEFDLSGVQDLAGNPLSSSAGPQNGRIRFTTGTYDALLNHSCGHVFFGPNATAVAAAVASQQAPRTDIAHTRFTVELPVDGGGSGLHSGFTRLRAPARATWHLFLDGDLAVSALDGVGQPIPTLRRATASACVGITHEVIFQLNEADQVFLRFGAQIAPVARFIVEQVTDAAPPVATMR
jgi:Bacterial Ig-like domain